ATPAAGATASRPSVPAVDAAVAVSHSDAAPADAAAVAVAADAAPAPDLASSTEGLATAIQADTTAAPEPLGAPFAALGPAPPVGTQGASLSAVLAGRARIELALAEIGAGPAPAGDSAAKQRRIDVPKHVSDGEALATRALELDPQNPVAMVD